MTHLQNQLCAATTELYPEMHVSLSCTHCRDSYRPFAPVIRPSNSSVAPEAAVATVMAGMGWGRAPGRQRRLTGMFLGWTSGADCDPWVSRSGSTWAGSSSWETWAAWHRVDSKWERWSNQRLLTYLVGVRLVPRLLYERLLCTHFVSLCSGKSPNGAEIPSNLFPPL